MDIIREDCICPVGRPWPPFRQLHCVGGTFGRSFPYDGHSRFWHTINLYKSGGFHL